tara:strand:- start:3573 stop:4511 length:939 start_codon:yes stop_codon:yes gene_type:complete
MSQSSSVRTVIDIGTNSVKVLVARVVGSAIEPIFEKNIQTRLGRGLYETKRLSDASIRHTAEVIAEYMNTARSYGSERNIIVATSAARDAENHQEFRQAIHAVAGQYPEIISGDREAELAYRGIRAQPGLDSGLVFVVDVGGGSTEFIVGSGETPAFSISIPLGSVRAMSQFNFADPPGEEGLNRCLEFVREFLDSGTLPKDQIRRHLDPISTLAGTGGTTTFLSKMFHETDDFDREQIETTVLDRATLMKLTNRLWTSPLEQRKKIPGIPPERADVIPFGAAIHLVILDEFNLDKLVASTRGIRTGLLLDE